MKKDKKKLTIYVDAYFDDAYKAFLETRYDLTIFTDRQLKNGEHTSKIDLLVFTGGADVDPVYYNEAIGKYTGIDLNRDRIEMDMANNFYNVPKLGICRGAQFLTVFSRGRLVQHVEGHLGNHKIENAVGSIYEITSTHHQMMYPYKLAPNTYELLAWSEFNKSSTYLNGDNKEIELPEFFLEPEIIYYPGTLSLCVQGHPEADNCPQKTKEYILNLIDNYLLKENKK